MREKYDNVMYAGDVRFETPKDERMYTTEKAVGHISCTARESSDRAAMIKYMVEEKLVPCSMPSGLVIMIMNGGTSCPERR